VARAERLAAPLAAERVAAATAAFLRDPVRDALAPPQAQPQPQPLGDLVARAFRHATGAEVAAVHPGELRADLPAGPVTRADLYAALPGGHGIVTLRLTGEQLRRFLEEQWLRDRTSRLHLAGIVADVVLDAPRGQRVRRPRLTDGTPMDRGRAYTVAMSGFLAGGGDGFRVPLAAAERSPGPRELDAVADYLRKLPQPITIDHITANGTPPAEPPQVLAAASAAS
jgi:5'-nucleotidase